MRMVIPALCFTVGFALFPAPSWAQETDLGREGTPVRVHHQGQAYQGVLVSFADGEINIRQPGIDLLAFPLSEVDALETRTSGRRWKLGALLGAIGTGLVIGSFAESFESCFLRTDCDNEFHSDTFFGGFAYGAAVGGVVGGLVGALIRTERWEPVILPPHAPGPGAWHLGMRVPSSFRP